MKLTDAESRAVRVAINTLANVVADGLEEPEQGAHGPILSVVDEDSAPESWKPLTQW